MKEDLSDKPGENGAPQIQTYLGGDRSSQAHTRSYNVLHQHEEISGSTPLLFHSPP